MDLNERCNCYFFHCALQLLPIQTLFCNHCKEEKEKEIEKKEKEKESRRERGRKEEKGSWLDSKSHNWDCFRFLTSSRVKRLYQKEVWLHPSAIGREKYLLFSLFSFYQLLSLQLQLERIDWVCPDLYSSDHPAYKSALSNIVSSKSGYFFVGAQGQIARGKRKQAIGAPAGQQKWEYIFNY